MNHDIEKALDNIDENMPIWDSKVLDRIGILNAFI